MLNLIFHLDDFTKLTIETQGAKKRTNKIIFC